MEEGLLCGALYTGAVLYMGGLCTRKLDTVLCNEEANPGPEGSCWLGEGSMMSWK